MTTALIYIRQSRHKADQNTVSPEVQEQTCRALLEVQACDEVIVYSDLDISGGLPPEKRPGFMALYDRVRANDKTREPLVTATYSQSRVSRNNADSADFYAFIENRTWVDLVMVDGRFDRTPSGELTWAVMAAAATHLRKSTAKAIRDAYAHKNAQGKATGMPPYGFRWNGQLDKNWEPDPERAPVVQRIFDEYANSSISTKRLAERLLDTGAPTPVRAGSWRPDTVAAILANPTYAGLKYPTPADRRARRHTALIKATWGSLVERAVFERVQRLMRKKQPPVRRAKERREYVFQGLLGCRECGQIMQATTVYGIAYYHCRRDLPARERCRYSGRSVREDLFYPWVTVLVDRVSAHSAKDFLDMLRTRHDDSFDPADATRKIEAQQVRLGHRYELGHVPEDEYQDRWGELERRKAQFSAQPTEKSYGPVLDFLTDWGRASKRQKRDKLALMFEKLWVRRGPDEIAAYVPRAEHAATVEQVITWLLPRELQIDVPAIRKPGQTLAWSGKGGIRTLEGALHPLPA
jgi:DNA invertase Pin-like site-specific DNA recombinase